MNLVCLNSSQDSQILSSFVKTTALKQVWGHCFDLFEKLQLVANFQNLEVSGNYIVLFCALKGILDLLALKGVGHSIKMENKLR